MSSTSIRCASARETSSARWKQPPKKGPPRKAIAVFGATGRVGRSVVREALKADYNVYAFTRVGSENAEGETALNEMAEEHKEALFVVSGELSNELDLDRMLENTDAVVSCIGGAPSLSVKAEYLAATINPIMDGMERHQVKRLVVLSAAQVVTSSSWSDLLANRGPYWINYYSQLSRMEEFIRNRGNIDWTIVRPFALSDKAKSTKPVVVGDEAAGEECSREDLAHFIVSEAVVGGLYSREGVFVASR